MAEAEKLAPCPFCGGEASISTNMDESIWSHATVPYTRVGCDACEIGTDFRCEGWEPTAQEEWNLRAPPAPDAVEALKVAAQAVIDRWETPLWKNVPHTGEYIAALRSALEGLTQ